MIIQKILYPYVYPNGYTYRNGKPIEFQYLYMLYYSCAYVIINGCNKKLRLRFQLVLAYYINNVMPCLK